MTSSSGSNNQPTLSSEVIGEAKRRDTFLPAHLKVYNFIDDFIRGYSYSPNIKEISLHVELSYRYTHNVVQQLIGMGYLEQAYKRPRSIKILKTLTNSFQSESAKERLNKKESKKVEEKSLL